ncbi:hypothetical protein Droror1_Dr00025202, partial [Drosera rotundifolia]
VFSRAPPNQHLLVPPPPNQQSSPHQHHPHLPPPPLIAAVSSLSGSLISHRRLLPLWCSLPWLCFLKVNNREVSTQLSRSSSKSYHGDREFEHPLILIHQKKISNVSSILGVLELAVEKNRPLLIVGEDVDNEAPSMLILNKHHAGVKVCAIKAPGFGDSRKANLDDLASFTGGEVITDESGLSLDKVQSEMLGSAKKITVSVDDTVILNGAGDKKLIEQRCEE